MISVLPSPATSSERLAQPIRRFLEASHATLKPLVDRDFLRVEWQADLQSTMNLAQEAGAMPAVGPRDVEVAIQGLCAEGSDVVIRRLLAFSTEECTTDELLLEVAGSVGLSRLIAVEGHLLTIDSILRRIDSHLRQRPRPPGAEAAAAIRQSLALQLHWKTPA